MFLLMVMLKVRDHCHISGKYRGSVHKGCYIKVKLYIAHSAHPKKNYDSHRIMQELDKFNFKINLISNGLEMYMRFNINNTLPFIGSFQCLSSSLYYDKTFGTTMFIKSLSFSLFRRAFSRLL